MKDHQEKYLFLVISKLWKVSFKKIFFQNSQDFHDFILEMFRFHNFYQSFSLILNSKMNYMSLIFNMLKRLFDQELLKDLDAFWVFNFCVCFNGKIYLRIQKKMIFLVIYPQFYLYSLKNYFPRKKESQIIVFFL